MQPFPLLVRLCC
uniref:Uncharacterized protein n=1 Tax=Rhizophora mucronata TaxID=61149 RepID=A0A2P2QF16_RHIMU